MKNNLTKRQKLLASALNPYYEECYTRAEVKKAKSLAKGKYWYDSDFAQWVTFSPGGKRYFFELASMWHKHSEIPDFILNIYNNYQKRLAEECAKLWAAGKCSAALKLEKAMVGNLT